MKISCSLVLYRSRKDQFETAIENYLEAVPEGVIYVVDNSPSPLESVLFTHARVIYLHNQENVGFGAAHNRAIRQGCLTSDLHLILNPDIRFGADVLEEIAELFRREPKLVVAMPKIVYPDGSLQRLCKLLPTPIDLIARRFVPVQKLRQRLDYRYEMHELCQQRPSEAPTLSGCFLVARSDALIEADGFDERYFMYMEDVDLVRRLAMKGKSLYVPTVEVVHEYAKGSYRNYRLLSYHIQSAIRYFNKWGWIFDSYRKSRNRFCSENMYRITHTGTGDSNATSGNLLTVFDPNQVEINDLSR
jgi:GT2 family glycosyltransferase